ncbi:MAG: hypothetical protein QG652_1565 [Pseudomonadota bacterium]|nr:hypothetical protein [Pseudomonadota bacterium]
MQIHFSFRTYSIHISLVIMLCMMGIPGCAPQPEQVRLPEQVETPPVIKSPVSNGRINPAVAILIKQADALIKQRNWPEALAAIERAIRIDSRHAETWNRMAIIQLAKNNAEQSIQMANKSNSLAAKNKSLQAWNWSLISRAYTAMQKPDLAREAAQTSQRLREEAE